MIEDPRTTAISDDGFRPLDVEWMDFQFMPGIMEVSLFAPSSLYQSKSRLINMSPQTALNLLAWLERERPQLEELTKEKP